MTNPYGACDVFHTEKIVHVFIAGSHPDILRGDDVENNEVFFSILIGALNAFIEATPMATRHVCI